MLHDFIKTEDDAAEEYECIADMLEKIAEGNLLTDELASMGREPKPEKSELSRLVKVFHEQSKQSKQHAVNMKKLMKDWYQ